MRRTGQAWAAIICTRLNRLATSMYAMHPILQLQHWSVALSVNRYALHLTEPEIDFIHWSAALAHFKPSAQKRFFYRLIKILIVLSNKHVDTVRGGSCVVSLAI